MFEIIILNLIETASTSNIIWELSVNPPTQILDFFDVHLSSCSLHWFFFEFTFSSYSAALINLNMLFICDFNLQVWSDDEYVDYEDAIYKDQTHISMNLRPSRYRMFVRPRTREYDSDARAGTLIIEHSINTWPNNIPLFNS